MKGLKYVGTLSSNGIQTTSSANYEIIFDENKSVSDLTIIAEGNDLQIKLNNESNIHYLKVDEILNITDMIVEKITILPSGVKYRYDAMYF